MRWDSLKILAVLAATVSGQTRQADAILRVIDGERVELRSGATLRLAGLQAFPNLSFHRLPFLLFLDSLVVGKVVELELDDALPEDCGYLWRDSLLVNVELLRRGWMQVWVDTARFKYRDLFLAAENAARQTKSGGWKFTASVDSAKTAGNDTVYVTKSGKKYHRAGCRLLAQNKIALLLSQARINHDACRLCVVAANPSRAALALQPNGKAAAVQCWGKTKKGDRCKREAEAGSKYCWQHRRK